MPNCAYEPCANPFEALTPRRKFCSDHCRQRATREQRRAKLRTGTCDFCGSTFETRNARKRYCNEECREAGDKRGRRPRQPTEPATSCSTCGGPLPGKPLAVKTDRFCSWRCKLTRNMHDRHNYGELDAAHVACLDLQQAARHVPVFGPVELDEEQDDDERLPVAATESAPDGSPFEDEFGKPIRHSRTDWGLSEHRGKQDDERY